MSQKNRDELHRWLFCRRGGHEITFSQKIMPFEIFKEDATWGGTCHIGDIKCQIRIRHNCSAPKGKRLEVRFPHKELDVVVPIEETTLVGYVKIQGNFRDGSGKCFFEPVEESNN